MTEECARLSKEGHGGYAKIGKRNEVAKAQYNALSEAEQVEYEEKAKMKLRAECEAYRERLVAGPSTDPAQQDK